MSTATDSGQTVGAGDTQLVTFRLDDALIGVHIRQVEEINRHVDVTAVPHTPDYVSGVINLRGDVVTVVDLRAILGQPPIVLTKRTRTVIVRSQDERIGLLVDEIGEVVTAPTNQIDPPPVNTCGTDRRLFEGVHKLATELLVVLDVEATLTTCQTAS